MGAGALAQLSAACLGWRQANLSIGPEHREAQMVGEDPAKALVVWWKKKKKIFKNSLSASSFPIWFQTCIWWDLNQLLRPYWVCNPSFLTSTTSSESPRTHIQIWLPECLKYKNISEWNHTRECSVLKWECLGFECSYLPGWGEVWHLWSFQFGW